MSGRPAFSPGSIFPATDGPPPNVLAAPPRYIQGDGVLGQIGRYLSLVPSRRAAVLISDGGRRRDGARVKASLDAAGIECLFVTFGGECSFAEIDRGTEAVRASGVAVDCLVAVGGGKCLDAGKSIAYRLHVPMTSCPSLASNDAPCSALSVIYTPAGVTEAVEFFPLNPVLVVVDTRVVAEAPVRYLVSGMGDAMATWYEARTCINNPAARNMLFGRRAGRALCQYALCRPRRGGRRGATPRNQPGARTRD